MNGRSESKISNVCVAKPGNSPAITGVLRLEFEYFEFHIISPGMNQRFLSPDTKTPLPHAKGKAFVLAPGAREAPMH